MTEDEAIENARHAREVVTGWGLALWALAFGAYLTFGGAKGLTSPAYSLLMRTIHNHNEWVGITLFLGGIVSVTATVFTRKFLMAAAALWCGLWCTTISFYMGAAAIVVPGAGNANCFTSGLAAFFFFMRFLAYRRPQFVWLK